MPQRSKHYRNIYTNSFGLAFAPGEVTLRFGFVEDQIRVNESTIEEVGVVMSHTSVKILAYLLKLTIDDFERENKITIPFDQAKMDEIKKVVEQGKTILGKPS